MTLEDAARPTMAERPVGITCALYEPGHTKRCRHYVATGGCALPTEFMCSEWVKANPMPPASVRARALPVVSGENAPKVEQSPVPRDLFGNPLAGISPATPRASAAVSAPLSSAAQPGPTSALTLDVDQLRGLTSDDISSFKETGVEVHLRSESLGELWLVPEYTGAERMEITPEHVATVMRVLSVFPDARISAFAKASHPTHARPGGRSVEPTMEALSSSSRKGHEHGPPSVS